MSDLRNSFDRFHLIAILFFAIENNMWQTFLTVAVEMFGDVAGYMN